MSLSGSRASVEINLDEFERRLRAAGAQPAGMEDPLLELARLVETAKPAPPITSFLHRSPDQFEPVETAPLRPPFDLPQAEDDRPSVDEFVPPENSSFEDVHEGDVSQPEPLPARRPGSWRLKVGALALAGLAMIGAVFAMKGGVPGLAKKPPFIAAAEGPTKVQPPSEDAVSASNDAGANLLKDNTQSAHVKVVGSDEQPVDLKAQTSSGANPPAANPPADASKGTEVRGTVDTPVVVTPSVAPPAVASQFPDPKPVRTVSLRPDGTPIPATETPPVSAAPTAAAPIAEPPKLAAKPSAKAASDGAANPQPSTPKLELPTKLSGKSSARVVVAKTDTTAPTDAEPLQLGAGAKPAKAVKPPQAQAATEPATPTAAAARPVDPTSATTSGGWAVQLAAPKSEAEARSDAARLSSKFASALGGQTLGVHKASVNGETIYRLRVVGLSKADAASLCARLKGEGGECFIAK